MMQHYKFIFSSKSLIAPIREDSGFCTIIPDWAQINKTAIDPQVLEETRLTEERIANISLGIICHAHNVTAEDLESGARFAVTRNPSAITITPDTQFKLLQVQEHTKAVAGFCKSLILPNVGRNVLPFWIELQEITLLADVFLKLHWKKTRSQWLFKLAGQAEGILGLEGGYSSIIITDKPGRTGRYFEYF